MDELLKLLDAHSGKLTLSLYQQNGFCWDKRGELRVTPKLIEELRHAVNAGENPDVRG